MSARIEVESLSKGFRIPVGAPPTLKQRVLHPLHRVEWREFDALHDVSFEVEDGEFFGIVGRNGCGKSTLLKLLSGIYHPDAGRIVVRGSVAPMIELGVGFNHELSARDNVFVNGTLLGLTARQLREKFDQIVDFAELDGFMDLKLRNFSSGMVVRLAFAVAILAESEILLVDEVLAVGDERFQKKCFDVFRDRRMRGQTVVFVTHDMDAMQQFCNRAMLLEGGRVAAIGDPRRIARAYRMTNAGVAAADAAARSGGEPSMHLVRGTVNDADPDGDDLVAQRDERIVLSSTWRAAEPVDGLILSFALTDRYGRYAVRGNTLWSQLELGPLDVGDEVTVDFGFDNRLAAGRYSVEFGAASDGGQRLLGVADAVASFVSSQPLDTGGVYDPDITAEVRVASASG